MLTETKEKHNMSSELSFIWGKMRTMARRQPLRQFWGTALEKWGSESHAYVVLVNVVRATKHTFWQKVAAGHAKVAAMRSGSVH